MKHVIKLLLILCMWYGSAKSAVSQPLTLDRILQQIDHNNPMLDRYGYKADALNASAEGAMGWMAPMVGIGTFMTPYPGQRLMEERDKGSVMVSLEQQIPNPARLQANRRYLESKAAVEKEGRQWAFNQLRAEAKRNYYQWLIEEIRLGVVKENERIIDLMTRVARVRYPYNQGSLGNVYRLDAKKQQLENMKLMIGGEIEDKQFRLRSLMNSNEPIDFTADTTSLSHLVEVSITDDTVGLLDRRADIRQISQQIVSMELGREVQRYQSKPDFRLRFDHMQPIGNMPNAFTAMAMISIPIAPWSSRMYRSEIKSIGYEIDAMKKEQEAIVVETKGMLAGMNSKIGRMTAQLKNYREHIIPALKKNYESLMLGYEENREELPMVLDAWEAWSMMEMEYLDKLSDYYEMRIRYEKELEK